MEIRQRRGVVEVEYAPGEPMDMPGQSWNAASSLLAAAPLEGKVFVDGNAKAPVKRHR